MIFMSIIIILLFHSDIFVASIDNNKDKQRHRIKRQVNMQLSKIADPEDEESQPQQRNKVAPWEKEGRCNADVYRGEITKSPLKCYQCDNFSNDTEPACDSLWRALTEKEKKALEVRCPENRGHYCAKSYREFDNGLKKTVRGCFGQGPVETHIDGRHMDLRPGCVSYYDTVSLSTICFCVSDLCNKSGFLVPPIRIRILIWGFLVISVFSSLFYTHYHHPV